MTNSYLSGSGHLVTAQKRWIIVQHLVEEPTQGWSWIDTELPGQHVPHIDKGPHRLDAPAGSVERDDELLPDPFVFRMMAYLSHEQRYRLAMVSGAEHGVDQAFPGRLELGAQAVRFARKSGGSRKVVQL